MSLILIGVGSSHTGSLGRGTPGSAGERSSRLARDAGRELAGDVSGRLMRKALLDTTPSPTAS